MTYEEALAYIASLEGRGWRLGLDRMQAFVASAGLGDAIGGPNGPQFIHVAGTNGKGSTTAFLQSMFEASGFRTGAFFSPFVVDPRERVQFGREFIGKSELAAVTEALIPVAEAFSETKYGGITEFEFKTAVGFQYWKQKRCEWVALEVGLGGRLDATTVVTPKASVIVSIGLDHVHILGHTVEEIAFEKAGIVKPSVPVIVGDMAPEAYETIQRVAGEREAPLWKWGREVVWSPEAGAVSTPARTHNGLTPGLKGVAQGHNMALAVAAMDAAGAYISEETLLRGAATASLPGRFQVVEQCGRTVLLDGAHNAAAAEVLVKSIEARFGDRKLVLVTNMLAGHEPSDFYGHLQGRVSSAHVVPVDFHRATPVEEMVGRLRSVFPSVAAHPSISEGLTAAEAEAGADELVVVTGTFYLVGEVLRLIG